MDDINFGINSATAAQTVLGETNEVLKSRGLALNLGKTVVMSAKEAESHFLFKENLELTKLDQKLKGLKTRTPKRRLAVDVVRQFATHLKKCSARHKDKVTRRYFTLLGNIGEPVGLAISKSVFSEQPSLRGSVLKYFTRLPFRTDVARVFVRLLKDTTIYDDVTKFAFVQAAVDWRIPRNQRGSECVSSIRKLINKPKTPFDWLCYVLFLAKYGDPHEALNAAVYGKKHFSREPFFARQIMAILPRGLSINPTAVHRRWREEASVGPSDSASVATNLLAFLHLGFPRRRDRSYLYLFPATIQKPYPIAKFLLLCVIAYSEKTRGRLQPRPEVAAQHRRSLVSPLAAAATT
jgi:hypothetical protein